MKAKKKVAASKGRITDARTKIIQKKRKNVVDARDILAKMAKTKDVRGKLLKIREQNKSKVTSNVKVIGNGILRKTDRNGKIWYANLYKHQTTTKPYAFYSLVTNKNKPPPPTPASSITDTIKQQLGLAQRTHRKLPARNKPYEVAPPIIRKTIMNVLPHFADYDAFRPEDDSLYRWVKPARPTAVLARRPIARQDDQWRYHASPQRYFSTFILHCDGCFKIMK